MKAFRLLVALSLSLTVVSSYCPDKCLCLWYSDRSLTINCSGSEQTEVPYGIDPQVKVLDLSYNDIRYYNHSKLLKRVEEIDLSNNKISEASFGGSFKYLRCIDLSYNFFADLGKIDVEKLEDLKKLNVSHNAKLQNLSGLKSKSLEYLDLSHCSVTYLNEELLESLPSIRTLDISFNAFPSLTNIRSNSLENLDASHGTLENLTQFQIYNFPELKKLNISFNPNLNINFSYENSCWDVEELDLSNSELTSLQEMFPFCSLKTLNVSLNQINVIEVRTFFNNCELSFANLSNNKIAEVHSRSFFTTDKLKILDLSVNLIKNLDFSIYLRQVTDLDLSRNLISSLSGLVLKNVINLNLAYNKIKEISVNLNENAPKVKNLNLSFNEIKSVKKIKSQSVTRLDLSHCKIAYVDLRAFEGAQNLVRINLVGNKLTTLDFRIFKDLENLKDLLLLKNQWACNCQSQEFKEFYDFLTVDRSLTNVQELKCFKSNETWRETCTNSWNREKEWKKTVYSLTVSLAIALIVVAVIFFCKYFNDKKQSDDSGRRTGRGMEQDEEQFPSYDNSMATLHLTEQEEIPQRRSTPPPNYEAALLLPKLTEAQRNLAISTLSITSPAKIPEQDQNDIRETTTTDETEDSAEENENQNFNRSNN